MPETCSHPNILILTAHTGGGHVSLATALEELLTPLAHVTVADPIPRSIAAQYRLMSRYARWLWGAGYRLTDTPMRAQLLHQFFALRFAPALDTLLRTRRFDLVMTTYPFLTSEVTRAIKRLPKHIPFVALFADPERVHHTWLSEGTAAAILAPTRETYAQASSAGFAPERLHLSGWPVRRQFTDGIPARATTLKALGFDADRFTVFVQGGGEGSAQFAQSIMALRGAGVPQIILAAGTDLRLERQFQQTPGIRAIPFMPDIAPLMAAADLIVGKAGPNTLFEAVMLGKPFLATTYIPGQEQGNLEFIRRHGLGWVALTLREQHQLIGCVMGDPALLTQMRATVQHYRAWNINANSIIPAVIAKLYQSPQPTVPVAFV
jgi:UDP-N-acetylglucosamine:LPS N-acetylglucosamine transferase